MLSRILFSTVAAASMALAAPVLADDSTAGKPAAKSVPCKCGAHEMTACGAAAARDEAKKQERPRGYGTRSAEHGSYDYDPSWGG